MIEIKKIGASSITIIQSLAQITWPIAYREILSPEQMAYMLDKIYSHSALQNQIEAGHQFILATDNDGPVAFASYAAKSQETPGIFRLHKIYIHPNQQGKGIGKNIIDYIVHDILPTGATMLELNVNRQNPALHFYKKIGFTIIKTEDIDIGNGYFMNDYVMGLPLNIASKKL